MARKGTTLTVGDKVTAACVLAGAADYFDRYGGTRGWMGRHGGPRCALGAIASAAKGLGGLRAQRLARSVTEERLSACRHGYTVPGWFDGFGSDRTATDVATASFRQWAVDLLED